MAQGRSTKIISMFKWIRTSRLSVKISLSRQAGLLKRFGIKEAALPHIQLFASSSEKEGGLAYAGQLTLDGIARFLQDAVQVASLVR